MSAHIEERARNIVPKPNIDIVCVCMCLCCISDVNPCLSSVDL